MDRDEKKKNAEELHEELEKARGIILSGFQGSRWPRILNCAGRSRGTGAQYKVVKNSLIERAAKGTPVEPIAKKLAGPLPWPYRNRPVALAKILTEYAKENPISDLSAGWWREGLFPWPT